MLRQDLADLCALARALPLAGPFQPSTQHQTSDKQVSMTEPHSMHTYR